jgi:DNA-binding NarL/FixJ family response regulator
VAIVDEPDFAGTEVRGAPRGGRVPGEGGEAVSPAAGLLTGRELVVLQLLAVGYSRDRIRELLWMPEAALEAVERSACRTLGVATAEEAVERARRRRLVL